MARLSIRLLGPLQVTLDGEPITGFASDKVRALLAYLATETASPHRRERLAGLLWPQRPRRRARVGAFCAWCVHGAGDDRLLSAALIAEFDRLLHAGDLRLGAARSEVIPAPDPLDHLQF